MLLKRSQLSFQRYACADVWMHMDVWLWGVQVMSAQPGGMRSTDLAPIAAAKLQIRDSGEAPGSARAQDETPFAAAKPQTIDPRETAPMPGSTRSQDEAPSRTAKPQTIDPGEAPGSTRPQGEAPFAAAKFQTIDPGGVQGRTRSKDEAPIVAAKPWTIDPGEAPSSTRLREVMPSAPHRSQTDVAPSVMPPDSETWQPPASLARCSPLLAAGSDNTTSFEASSMPAFTAAKDQEVGAHNDVPPSSASSEPSLRRTGTQIADRPQGHSNPMTNAVPTCPSGADGRSLLSKILRDDPPGSTCREPIMSLHLEDGEVELPHDDRIISPPNPPKSRMVCPPK